MRDSRSINARQRSVLERIAAGDELSAPEDVSLRTTVYALVNRGLVVARKRGGVFCAAITDRGRMLLDGDGVSAMVAERVDPKDAPPASDDSAGVGPRVDARRRPPPAATARIAAERSAAASALIDRLVADKKFVVERPDETEIAYWRKVVDFAKRHGMAPEGARIEKRMTWLKNLEISLVTGPHFNSAPENEMGMAPVQVPDSLDDLHPVVAALKAPSERLQVCPDCMPRTLKILQAMAEATERLGHAIEPGASDDAAMTLHIHQSRFDVTIGETYEEAAASEQPKYDWQRVTTFEQVPTGRLELYLLPRKAYYHYHAGRHNWGDRKRWRLEDKLPEALNEIIGRGVAAEEDRLAKERAAVERRQQWEAAMEKARRDFAEDYRASALRGQIKRWREAQEINAFCDAAESVLAAAPDATYAASAMEWMAWARERAARLDPLGRDLHAPAVPDPKLEDLKPFLRGWSPYGP